MQSMPHTVSRNTTLFFTPMSLLYISRTPAIPMQWQTGLCLDHGWTMLGLVCCCRLTHHMLCSPLGALAVSWSSVPVWTGVSENFSSYLEEVKNRPESESRGSEATSSITSLQLEWGLWKCIAIAKPVPCSTLLGPYGKQGIQLQIQKPFIKICSVVSNIEITSLHMCCIPFHCWL